MFQKFENTTKYFGFLVPISAWGSIALMCMVHPINHTEPLSQFGYYQSTKLIFGTSLTLGAIVWYLFSRNLDKYWRYTSFVTLLAGLCYTTVGWVPYQPNIHAYVIDVHNLMILGAVGLYSLPMLFIGYKKKHSEIARASFLLFCITFTLLSCGFIIRLVGGDVLYVQLAAMLPTTIWLVIVNKLLLEDLKVSPNAKSL